MKKIFTLLFAVGIFAVAQAQPGTRDNRQNDQRNNQQTDQQDRTNSYGNGNEIGDNHNPYERDGDRYGRNDDRYGKSSFSNERRMRMQISRINQEFDYKINRVRNSYFLNRWEKQRQIRFLEDQRQWEIRMVYAKFKNKNRHDDRNDRPHGH